MDILETFADPVVSVFERVAVIGAGVSGLAAARHLIDYGLDVTIFERSSKPGGVWAYDERKPLEYRYPSVLPSVAGLYSEADSDCEDATSQSEFSREEILKLKHAPPGPAYFGLTTNISTKLQEMKDHPWKEGTGDFVNVKVVGEYLNDYAKRFHLERFLKYNTKVETIKKVNGRWIVRSKLLNRTQDGNVEFLEHEEAFDKIVVASGHYHANRVPDIKGLKEWKRNYPGRVMHSKAYRRPQELAGQVKRSFNWGSVSSTDIAREINGVAKTVYQSTRGGQFDLPLSFLPPSAKRVGECVSFEFETSNEGRGVAHLKDGTTLSDIDKVIICTGYHISYPFLHPYHNDLISPAEANETVLVTDGTQVHNLHKDIFYIPDPTLAFVGTAYYVSTFSLFEFQAITLAAVFAGKAYLPREEEMRKEYRFRVIEKGFGRAFHALNEGREPEYVRELVDWINADAASSGGQKVEGHSEEWLKEDEIKMGKLRDRFEKRKQEEKQEESPRIYNLWSEGKFPNSEFNLFNGSGNNRGLEEQTVG
ncbi:putative fad dependent protein [Botrytis fragariae]|uniref:Putative fad dependent protein n=1 Tax=Botrytis fragariae TaxID=1964551 RepID=A0A8H6EKF8_9HELO|nr:putative fad dependent protein [Botrytis fragariae]KAF5875537.1 putative fad dependent protein [Botrytis fragariae]